MEKSPTEGMSAEEVADFLKSNGEAVVRTAIEYLKERSQDHDERDSAVATLLLRHVHEIEVGRISQREQQAMQSLKISEASALASQRSARWTMVAALVALASILIPLFEKHHWFGL